MIYEELANGVAMVTTISRTGVWYGVRHRDQLVWHKFVPFGKTRAARLGGANFQLAAREQERIAGEIK